MVNNEKLSFAIDNVELVKEDENSNFSILSLDFFASGDNLHELFVSDEVLLKTANTIKNCPVIWKYDTFYDDATTHGKDQIPVGFVPESSEIISRKLDDGRTMLNTISYVWKQYSGKLLDIFKRDKNDKPVSVEMSVFKEGKRPDGSKELLDYRFEAITVLGSLVKPAIPMAHATFLQFAKDYQDVYDKEFSSYDNVDMLIPQKLKDNVQKGLSLSKEHKKGMSSVVMATAHHLSKNDKSTVEKVRHISKTHKSFDKKSMQKSPPNDSYIKFLLYGGEDGASWSQEVSSKLDQVDANRPAFFSDLITFPYTSAEDMNPALKGIDPPVTLAQGNAIAKQADAIGADKGGWGMAIKHFHDSHIVKDGHWVEKDNNGGKEKMSMKDEKDKEDKIEEMAAPTPAEKKAEEDKIEAEEEKKEDAKEEKLETLKEEKEEEKKEDKKSEKTEKMSLDVGLDLAAMLVMLEDETEGYQELVDESNKEQVDYSKFAAAMHMKMKEMKSQMEKMSEDNKNFASENEGLKKFKADMEAKQFETEVSYALKEIENSVDIPKEEMEKLVEESKKFSFDTLDACKNLLKSRAFSFAVKGVKKPANEVIRYGLPWVNVDNSNKGGSPWVR